MARFGVTMFCARLWGRAGPSAGKRSLAHLLWGGYLASLGWSLGCCLACDGPMPWGSPPSSVTAASRVASAVASTPRDVANTGGGVPGASEQIRLIAFNDFHGNLLPLSERGREVGGAEALAGYIRHAQRKSEGRSLIIHAGDHVGASPPESGLLQDEPSIALLNLLSNSACRNGEVEKCDVVGTLGNHEFDEGVEEMQRLLRGGNSSKGPFLDVSYGGSRVPYVSANVHWRESHEALLPAYVVRTVGSLKVGIIGAVLEATPRLVAPGAVVGVTFEDEVTAINRAATQLVAEGVRVIVVTIHQGLNQSFYSGPTRREVPLAGALLPIIEHLHEEIDVVISGHTHAFTNAYVPNNHGGEVLVTQALSAGRALGVIDLRVESDTGRVLDKVAEVKHTYVDGSPARVDGVSDLVARATARVAPLTERIVGRANVSLRRSDGPSGESPLGDLIADAQRAATRVDFAFTNLGGIRGDLPRGKTTWGRLFALQPFGNHLVKVTMTGAEVAAVLERQFQSSSVNLLQISGFRYAWDPAASEGRRVRNLTAGDGTPLKAESTYQVVMSSYLASGGDGFFEPAKLQQLPLELTDLDALVEYFKRSPQGVNAPRLGRIRKVSVD